MESLNTPPPRPPATLREEDDRDDDIVNGISPYLDELRRRFLAAGWHPAEVACAAYTWVLLRMLADAEETATDAAWAAVEELPVQTEEVIAAERLRRQGRLPGLPTLGGG